MAGGINGRLRPRGKKGEDLMKLGSFLKLELKNFLGARIAAYSLLAFLLAGAFSAIYSNSLIEKQKAILAEIPGHQSDHLSKQLELNKADLGNLLYYLQFSAAHQPSSWAGFSIGQRDVNPYNLKVRMLALEGQLYDSEFSNPNSLLFGNFDPSFIIIFLLPLLVIAFTYDVVSFDIESGSWNLLRSQPVSLARVVLWRLLVRFAVLCGITFAFVFAANLYLGGKIDERLAYALLSAFAYMAFWFLLAAFISSFLKNSSFNAISLIGAWIFLAILLPAFLNLAISTAFPVSESFDLTIAMREGYHQKWDRRKAETMEKFYADYPDYRDFPIPEDKFSWGWYYAMQNMGDKESANSAAKYIEKLEMRDKYTNLAALFIPTINTQAAFSSIAQNDLRNHLDYLGSVKNLHKEIREYFYPYIFRNSKVEEVDWNAIPKHSFENEQIKPAFPSSVFAVFAAAILLFIAAFYKFAGLS